MRPSHKILTLVITALYAIIWVFAPSVFALGALETGLWHGFMGIITLSIIVSCLHFLRPDRKIVSIFLGDAYKVSARKGGHQGLFNTGIVWVYPPFLNRALYIPAPVFTVPFKSTSANTKKDTAKGEAITPVTVFIHLQIRFSSDDNGIRSFLEAIPVLEKYRPDLTTPHKLSFHDGVSAAGEPLIDERDCPCVAALLLEQLQSTVNEAVGRAIPKFTLSEVLGDIPAIEAEINRGLPGTVFEQAEFITSTGTVGTAAELFDFNVAAIIPTDPETARSLSSETRASYEAKGQIATAEGQKEVRTRQGQGEAEYVKLVAAEAKSPEGQLVLAATTLQKLPDGTTLVATPNVLDAVVAQLVKPPKNP